MYESLYNTIVYKVHVYYLYKIDREESIAFFVHSQKLFIPCQFKLSHRNCIAAALTSNEFWYGLSVALPISPLFFSLSH